MKKQLLSLLALCLLNLAFGQIPTSNLSLWLKADTGVKNSSNSDALDGEKVQTWEDQSGNANHAIQINSNDQPDFLENANNQGNALRFNGDLLECADNPTLNPTELSIFIVGKYAVGGGGSYQSFLMKTPTSNWTDGGYGVTQNSSNSILTGWVNEYNTLESVGYSLFNQNENILFTMIYQPGSIQVFNDGVSANPPGNAPTLISNNMPLLIGNSNGGYDLNGDISEIIIYSSALSPAEQQTVETYLRNKYPLTPLPTNGTWETMPSGTTNSLLAMHFSSESTGYAVGTNSVLKTTDIGLTWNPLNVPSNTYGCVHFRDNQHGLSGGNGGQIIKTINGGADWTSATTPVSANIWGICHLSSSNAIAVGGNGVILRTTDGGNNWNQITSGTTANFWGVNFWDDLNGIAVGFGVLLTTDDGGLSWDDHSISGSTDLRGVWYLEANTAIAVGNNGSIYKTINNGTTWTLKATNIEDNLFAVHFINNMVGIASGDDGSILITNDGGESWTNQASGTTQALRGAAMSSTSYGFVDGFGGTIKRSIFQNLGIELDGIDQKDLTIYPNPCDYQLNILIGDIALSPDDLVCTDLNGKRMNIELTQNTFGEKMECFINTAQFSTGVYLLSIHTKSGPVTKRFVVNH